MVFIVYLFVFYVKTHTCFVKTGEKAGACGPMSSTMWHPTAKALTSTHPQLASVFGRQFLQPPPRHSSFVLCACHFSYCLETMLRRVCGGSTQGILYPCTHIVTRCVVIFYTEGGEWGFVSYFFHFVGENIVQFDVFSKIIFTTFCCNCFDLFWTIITSFYSV